MKGNVARFGDKGDNTISFFDNAYGDMAVMIFGPKNGEKGDVLLSEANVIDLVEFLNAWLSYKSRAAVK